MTRYSKLFLYFTGIMLLSWALPWCWEFFTSKPAKTPFTLYSPVIRDFAMLLPAESGPLRTDRSGGRYTTAGFDSILPFFYYRQLMADGKFPDTVAGKAVTPQMAQHGNFMFRHTPSDINRIEIPLYPLLESRSGRIDLEMPGDVFRIRDRIEFIDSKSNRIKEEKSRLYNRAITGKGVHFPLRTIAGNPTTRKEYDEGYFLVDRDYGLFHLKQTVGRPFVRKINLPAGIRIKNIFVTEFRNRKTYAFLTDETGKFYALQNPGYTLKPLPIPAFYPEKEGLTIIGNPLVWTLLISGSDGTRVYAMDAGTYVLLDEMNFRDSPATTAGKAGDWLFPFRLSFTSGLDKEVFPRLSDLSLQALPLNIVLALLLFLYRRKKGKIRPEKELAVLVGGLYAFICLLAFQDKK